MIIVSICSLLGAIYCVIRWELSREKKAKK